MLKHLKGARIMQDCATGNLHIDAGTGGGCMPLNSFTHGEAAPDVLVPIQKVTLEWDEYNGCMRGVLDVDFKTALADLSWSETTNTVLFTVHVDGVNYTCGALHADPLWLGNGSVFGDGVDTGEPFVMVSFGFGLEVLIRGNEAEHTIGLSRRNVKALDAKYLPSGVPCKCGLTLFEGMPDFTPVSGGLYAATLPRIEGLPVLTGIRPSPMMRLSVTPRLGHVEYYDMPLVVSPDDQVYFGDGTVIGLENPYNAREGAVCIEDGNAFILAYSGFDINDIASMRLELSDDTLLPAGLMSEDSRYDVVIQTSNLDKPNNYSIMYLNNTDKTHVRAALVNGDALRFAVCMNEYVSGGWIRRTMPCYEVVYNEHDKHIELFFMSGSMPATYGNILFQAPMVYRLVLRMAEDGYYRVTSVDKPVNG